jgi:aminocarboxymuconate-semialdehyde decarboxylase
MSNRRDFLKSVAGASAGMLVMGGGRSAMKIALESPRAQGAAPVSRRQVSVAGKRVKVVDIHSHCTIPEVADVIKGTPLERAGGGRAQLLGPERIQALDQRGIDLQVVHINAFWWYAATDRDLAAKIVMTHNEGLAKWCSSHSDRFAALTSVSLQFPDLAAEQLETAVKQLGLKGAAIGGHVNGEPLSMPKYDPFWAKAEELGVIVFMHPGGATNVVKEDGLKGAGDLGNIIGDPLETTVFMSHLIYEGTLDKFPGLKIVGAHAGGYIPSYMGRTDVACDVRPNAKCVNKKHPSEYFKGQLMTDAMIFTDEGLRHLVAQLGADHVMYGTDIPFNWPDNVDMILNASYLNNAEKEAILGGNSVKLLKL